MRMLNDLFSRFDNLLDQYGLRKVRACVDFIVIVLEVLLLRVAQVVRPVAPRICIVHEASSRHRWLLNVAACCFAFVQMDTIGDGYVVAGGLTRVESDSCGPTGGGAMGTQPLGPHAAAPDSRTAAACDSTAAGADDTALAAQGAGAKASPSFTAQFSPPQAARAVFKFAQV